MNLSQNRRTLLGHHSPHPQRQRTTYGYIFPQNQRDQHQPQANDEPIDAAADEAWHANNLLPGASDLAETDEVTYLDGMVLANGLNLVCGPPGAGKSTFAMALAVTLVAGGDILGTTAMPMQPVMANGRPTAPRILVYEGEGRLSQTKALVGSLINSICKNEGRSFHAAQVGRAVGHPQHTP